MNKTMSRIKAGDIFSIQTPNGYSFFQVTHIIPRTGAVIRVFDFTTSKNIDDLSILMTCSTLFKVLFPLSIAVSRGIVKRIGSGSVPECDQVFPVFRSGIESSKTGRIETWWLWDGQKEWKAENLTTSELCNLPFREVINDTALINRIESGWSHVNDRRNPTH